MAYQASEWTPDGVPRSGEWCVRELLNCVVRRPWGKFSETVSGHETPGCHGCFAPGMSSLTCLEAFYPQPVRQTQSGYNRTCFPGLRTPSCMPHAVSQPQAQRPSLFSVELRSGQWQQLVEWYREAIGLRVLVRVVDDGYALLEAGDTRLAILSRSQPGEASPRWSLGFEVADLDLVYGRLVAGGSEVSDPREQHEGFREIVATDPDGNRIRLFSWQHRG